MAFKVMQIKYINNNTFFNGLPVGDVLDSTDFIQKNIEGKNVGIIKFKPFIDLDYVEIAFSTRLGGVSTDYSSSMNFAFDRGDLRENVLENFRIFTKAINTTPSRCVYSKQTHTTNVLYVDESNAGMGITKERNFDNIDGLITDKKNLCLVNSYADCVPLIFVDTKNKVIAASHSGWRGTVGNITKNTLNKMYEKFGTKPKDVRTFIGPSICMDCYEISTDVADEFKKAYSQKQWDKMLLDKHNGHFQLNLHIANYFNMVNSGISPENINVTNICTCCNPDLLFSHRASNGRRGVLCSFIYLK